MYKLTTHTCLICSIALMLSACGNDSSNNTATKPFPPKPEPKFYNNGMPADMKTDPRGLPLLHSLPTAKGQIYLDFDGDFDMGSFHPGIDFDGDPDNYNDREQELIYNWWISTAAHFSMFDIDVTTEIDTSRPNTWVAIFPGGKFGVAYGRYKINLKDIVQATANHGPYSSVVGHEAGHTFGLPHVVGLDNKGQINSGYYRSPYPLRGWHLGTGDMIVNKWSNKFRANKKDTYFGGVEQIASRIRAFDSNSTGFRPDDHQEALILASKMEPVEGVGFRAAGVIETLNDTDSFYFDWSGGYISVSSHAFELSPVNINLNLYDSTKQRIAMQHNGINHQWISGKLAPGRYYISLQSAKRYSDLGEYRLRVNALPEDWCTANIGPKRSINSTTYNSHTKQWTLKSTGGDIWGSRDNFLFIYKKLIGEGQIIAKIDSNNVSHPWAKFGVMVRGNLSENSPQFSLLLTGNHGPGAFFRTTVNDRTYYATNKQNAARWVKIERLESVDKQGNKTGKFNRFKASTSADGNHWDPVTEKILDLPTEVYIGLAQSAQNKAQMLFTSFSSVKVTGKTQQEINHHLPAPANLTANNIDHNKVDLLWDAVANATEYQLERSQDGLSFNTIARLSATNYVDTNLTAGVPYSYRVSALTPQGQSPASASLKVQIRSEGPQDLTVISLDEKTIILDWGEPFGQRGYRIERSEDGSNYDVIAAQHADYNANVSKGSHADTQKYVDKGLKPGTQYYYRITTLDAQGQASYSEVNGYTHLATPKTALSAVDKSNQSVTFDWSDIPGAENIQIEKRTKASDTWIPVAIVSAADHSYTDTVTGDNEQYIYRIKATSATNQSDWKEFDVLVVEQRADARYMDATEDQQWKPVAGNWGSMTGEPDAAVQWSDASDFTYLFKGKYYWRYKNSTGEISEAKPIKDNWKGPLGQDPYWYNGIDAAVRWNNKKVYFFKGSRYIRMYTRNGSSSDGLSLIADDWYMDADIDAAMNTGDGKLLFFKGSKYIVHNMTTNKPETGPLPAIQGEINWKTWEKPVSAAFKNGKSTYLFERR